MTVTLLAACADAPGESTTIAAVTARNKLAVNKLAVNKLAVNKLAVNKLAAVELAARRLTLNPRSAGDLTSTADGREVLSFVVSCALPEGLTLEARVGGATFEFAGELGLAPEWLDRPLSSEGQGWISACLFARVNAHDVSIPISLRGPTRALAVGQDERADWPLQEGAFYGDVFTPAGQPILWIACRGEDQAAGEVGGLIDRDCTEPDPAHPGLTQCGFIFAGDCGTFSAEPVCEEFSERATLYQRCHAEPIDDERHHGHRHHHHGAAYDRDDRVFQQVVTTYVTP
jgi:hypothetical protein